MDAYSKPERLFFALQPAPALQRKLAGLAETLLPPRNGARVAPVQNLHLTLVFLGPVDRATRICIEQGADTVRVSAFELVLDQLGCLRRRGLFWVGASAVPSALNDLVTGLRAVQVGCGLAAEARQFRAHVTLARHLRRCPRDSTIAPVVWSAQEFSLLRSTTGADGARYDVLRTWTLA